MCPAKRESVPFALPATYDSSRAIVIAMGRISKNPSFYAVDYRN